jgi:DNA-binding MarR family transcriptional regulator
MHPFAMEGSPGSVLGTPQATDPQSPEEAVIMLVMQAGRSLRSRHPEDQVDPSSFPLAKQLMCSAAMRVSDCASRLGLDASTVSRQIKQLEDKGIVERTPDPADGRASLVQISTAGSEVMRSAFRRRYERIQAVLAPWTEADRAKLQELLTRLVHDLAAANDRDAAAQDEVHTTSHDPQQTAVSLETKASS